jgi:hypothetical protein
MTDGLDRLAVLTPEPGRAARVRARCRTELAQSRRRPAVIVGFAQRVVVPAIAGVFCVLYVAMLVATTLHFQGVF